MIDVAALTATHGREALRAASRAELWRHGRLSSWTLHEMQLEGRQIVESAHARGVRRAVWIVGRRGGKTRFFVVDAFEHALKHPRSRIPYGALTWQSATDYVYPEAEALIATAPADLRPAIVDGDVRFANGSVIPVRGTDTKQKANSMRGPAAARAYLDECGFNPVLDYVVKSVIAQQLLTTGGLLQMGSSPPETPAHPFAATYVDDARRRSALVTYRTEDAPHITTRDLEALAAELGGRDSVEWRRECDCELIPDERRAVLPEWSKHRDKVAPSTEAAWPTRSHRDWYVAADLGYIDGTSVLLGWYDYDTDRIVIEAEAAMSQPVSWDVQDATARLEEEHIPEGQRVVSRVADAPAMTVAELARLQPDGVHDEQRWRLTAKHDLMGAVNEVRTLVRSERLLIHPRCSVLRDHCHTAVWDTHRHAFERQPGVVGLRHFDALAALVYFVRAVKRGRNPYPFVPPSTVDRWVPPEMLKQPEKRRIPSGRRRL